MPFWAQAILIAVVILSTPALCWLGEQISKRKKEEKMKLKIFLLLWFVVLCVSGYVTEVTGSKVFFFITGALTSVGLIALVRYMLLRNSAPTIAEALDESNGSRLK